MPILHISDYGLVRLMLIAAVCWIAVVPASMAADGKKPARPSGPPVSKTKQRVDEMIARTRPGYYTKHLAKNRKESKTANARVVIDCGSSCNLTPLPVTLVTFTGKRLDARQIQLEWTTTSEVNNDHFEIERTLNPAEGFHTAGSVKGQGTTAANVSYQFTDPNAESVYTYYRLKQVDLDGSFTYSRIIAIKGFNQELTVNAFPNPGVGKEVAFIVSGGKKEESISITISDQRGSLVYKNADYKLSENQLIYLPGVSMQAGSYYIQISTKEQQARSSFILIK
ncbi:MAG: T9SS type A sorting domain-containing protein [Dyadobacter sp.]